PEINITTIEDPIEMVHEEFNQTSVQSKIGITFGAALRTILRQDPDIIMVGEIRDAETAENAVQAALTGHLVFSTLHTNDSSTSVTRLVDLGIQPFLISSTLIGAMAQRLDQRGGNEERLDTEVDQTGDGGGGVVRVQRREDEMSGQRGLNGILRSFSVANFADHDDVRILPKDGAQRGAKSDTDLRLHRRLIELFVHHFDRIFDRGDVDFR